jgi:DNA-binding NarL/FixJ family response regulator
MMDKQSCVATDKIKIFIVDDHPIIRQGLKELIDQESDLQVCGEADNVMDAVRMIKTLSPDVAIVDISLNKDMSGLDLLKELKTKHPSLLTLVLSMHDETVFAERVLKAGARGYVMKEEATEKVLVAIRRILGGTVYLSDHVSGKILSKITGTKPENTISGIDCLSDRELEVFELIGTGLGTREIADKLFLSVKTIEAHRMHIREKLKLKNSTELLQHAIQWARNEQVK